MNLSTPKTQEEIIEHARRKEYQDFVHYTNQTLNSLNQGIIALSIQNEKLFNKYMSAHKNLEIQFEESLSDINIKVGKAFSCIDDFRSDLAEIEGEVKDHLGNVNKNYVTKQDLNTMAEHLLTQFKLLDMSFTSLKAFVESKLSLMKGNVTEEIKASSEEVKAQMPKVDPIREEFKLKLEAFYVDFTGLVKEIALLKEAVKYGDKKFENIYTLIERLKKGIS